MPRSVTRISSRAENCEVVCQRLLSDPRSSFVSFHPLCPENECSYRGLGTALFTVLLFSFSAHPGSSLFRSFSCRSGGEGVIYFSHWSAGLSSLFLLQVQEWAPIAARWEALIVVNIGRLVKRACGTNAITW